MKKIISCIILILFFSFICNARNYTKYINKNYDYTIIVDYSISSGKNRFFVYNLKKECILKSLCECGKESKGIPIFSNNIGSNCSSLGKFEVKYLSKMSNDIPCFVLKGLDKSNNIIKWRQFLPDNNYTEIKYANDTDPTLTVTGLTPDKFNTGDPDKTYIYPGFVAYNPLSKRFYIFGMTFDSTKESAQPNLRLPHIVGVNAQTGAVIQFKNPSNKVSQPSDYQWSESGYPGTVSHTSNYTPFMPYGCTVISATKMVVFFNCATPGNAISIYGLVYTFSSDGSKLESVTDYNFHSYGGGVSHYQVYNTPDCARMFLIYSGPLYGLCGTGVTVPVARDYQRDNYRTKAIIRNQRYRKRLYRKSSIRGLC